MTDQAPFRPEHLDLPGPVVSLDWSPDGRALLVCCKNDVVELWRPWEPSGTVRHEEHGRLGGSGARVARWRPDGEAIAVGRRDGAIAMLAPDDLRTIDTVVPGGETVLAVGWSAGDLVALTTGQLLRWEGGTVSAELTVDTDTGLSVMAVSPDGRTAAVGLWTGAVGLPFDTAFVSIVDLVGSSSTRSSARRHAVTGMAWSPDGRTLAIAGDDPLVQIWDVPGGQESRLLEGHAAGVSSVAYASGGAVLVSRSSDGTARFWDTGSWQPLGSVVLDRPGGSGWYGPIAAHPDGHLLAVTTDDDRTVRLVDLAAAVSASPEPAVHHVTAKIVLLGESGVGKTSLGWRLAHGRFRDHPSTHGQQFWMLDELRTERADGAECEAVLWDLAGQPDHRLVHALFVDDADLALVLFDPAAREPLRGVDFWLRALAAGSSPPPVVLVGARTDRGDRTLTDAELAAYCAERGVAGHVGTSALTGTGMTALVDRLRDEVGWERLPVTTTTATFKRIKDLVLDLKERADRPVFSDVEDLRGRLDGVPSAADVAGAVGHLAKHGYVLPLERSTGEQVVLLAPELLNNLAASFVLEARRNPRGLGALDEAVLLRGGYAFGELAGLDPADAEVLLDAALTRFLSRNLCFREPHGDRVLLVFPELINTSRPARPAADAVEFASYAVAGAVQNVYAALVVLLGYTNVFSRSARWRNDAEYEVGPGQTCGLHQERDRDGGLQLVLHAGPRTAPQVRDLFRALVEQFLAGRQVEVLRIPVLDCAGCGYRQGRPEVLRRLRDGRGFAFCPECGHRNALPATAAPERHHSVAVRAEQVTATARTAYEAALVHVKALVRGAAPVRCFVSYAWGVPEHERWVETRLARDLRNAGLVVVLDRWRNATVGVDVARFLDEVDRADSVVVVGTPAYLDKYENRVSTTGSVVAAEMDLIHQRLTGTEERKRTVLPVLRAGTRDTALPPLLRGRTRADMTADGTYLRALFDLVVSLYGLSYEDPTLAGLRRELDPREPGRSAGGGAG